MRFFASAAVRVGITAALGGDWAAQLNSMLGVHRDAGGCWKEIA
jgi:hypothetical protein